MMYPHRGGGGLTDVKGASEFYHLYIPQFKYITPWQAVKMALDPDMRVRKVVNNEQTIRKV